MEGGVGPLQASNLDLGFDSGLFPPSGVQEQGASCMAVLLHSTPPTPVTASSRVKASRPWEHCIRKSETDPQHQADPASLQGAQPPQVLGNHVLSAQQYIKQPPATRQNPGPGRGSPTTVNHPHRLPHPRPWTTLGSCPTSNSRIVAMPFLGWVGTRGELAVKMGLHLGLSLHQAHQEG